MVHESILLSFSKLTVAYKQRVVLQNIDGDVVRGRLIAIVGPNGSGKSTLLKSIVKLVRPLKGSVVYKGIDLKKIAYLPQTSDIDRTFPLTVKEAVSIGLTQKKGFFQSMGTVEERQIESALNEVGLEGRLNDALNALSGGQFQRVLFARLQTQDADLILLDEPFNAIDPHTIHDLLQVIGHWHEKGKTILIVTHDIDIVRDYFPETLVLSNRVIAWGPTYDVLTRDNLQKAQDFGRQWQDAQLGSG